MPAKKKAAVVKKAATASPPSKKAAAPSHLKEVKPGMVKVFCKFSHEWGEPMNVAGYAFTTTKEDGTALVPSEVATVLFQNRDKWIDAASASKQPGKRMSFADANPGVPNAILRDPKSGRLLDDDEALRVLRKPSDVTRDGPNKGGIAGPTTDPLAVQAEQLSSQPSTRSSVNAKGVDVVVRDGQAAVADSVDLPRDITVINRAAQEKAGIPSAAAEIDWPEITLRNSKDEMIQVLGKLDQSGVVVDLSKSGTSTKEKCFAQILAGYEKLSEA